MLDGGVTSLEGYGATSLPCGVRVVGFQALRLLIADLGLSGPAAPFDGETVLDLEELRCAHRATGRSPTAVEQAELLASCHDAVLLRWVAATLAGVRSGRGGPQRAVEQGGLAEAPPQPPLQARDRVEVLRGAGVLVLGRGVAHERDLGEVGERDRGRTPSARRRTRPARPPPTARASLPGSRRYQL